MKKFGNKPLRFSGKLTKRNCTIVLNIKMNRESAEQVEWMKKCDYVVSEMNNFVRSYVTPLSHESANRVRLIGTGSFIIRSGIHSIITCHHVGAEGEWKLDYRLNSSDVIHRYSMRWLGIPEPVDVACTKDTLVALATEQPAIQPQQLALRHETSQKEELLYFFGFSGENSNFAFENLVSNGTGYLTQKNQEAASDGDLIELLWPQGAPNWSSETTEYAKKNMRFSDPRGFSGSLVWNTRFLEVGGNLDSWSPNYARVTGILKRFDPARSVLLATPIEKVGHHKLA